MKKRLVIIGLALALLSAGLMPAPVFAAAPNTKPVAINKVDPFKAAGFAFVYAPGTATTPAPMGNNLYLVKKTGEMIFGQIATSPDWPEFAGTSFMITESATTTLNPITGKFLSKADGTVVVFDMSGAPCMTGKYSALMHGNFMGDVKNSYVFYSVIDNGLIELNGIPGTSWEGITARGVVSATLTPTVVSGQQTLGGNITIHGVN